MKIRSRPDSNEGKEEEEDSSDYESSDDETTLPQVTTLESVLAMIPFTPDWWEARASRSVLKCSASIFGLLVSGSHMTWVVVSKFDFHAGGRRAPRTRPCTTVVAETNRAKHLVKLCEAGMHADALREQLHDSAQDFTDFNHVQGRDDKTRAVGLEAASVKHDQVRRGFGS